MVKKPSARMGSVLDYRIATRLAWMHRADIAKMIPPVYPGVAKRAGRAFTRLLTAEQPRTIAHADVQLAIDEWLLSSDRQRLSRTQCAVLGVALLEYVRANPRKPRSSLSILVALRNIAPAVATLDTDSLRLIELAMTQLSLVDIDELERSELSLVQSILARCIDAPPLNRAAPDKQLKSLFRSNRYDADHSIEIVLHLMQCRKLPPSLRRSLAATVYERRERS